MTLRLAPWQDRSAWDAFVCRQEGWTHCHLFGWRRVIERVFGHPCWYTAAIHPDGRLAGVLPLVRVRSLLFGDYLVSMPFLNYGGPLGEPGAVDRLARYAVAQAADHGVRLLELRSRTELPVELPVSHRKITVVLDLTPGDPGRVWAELPAKVRSQVRRPRKEGIVVRFGPDQVEPFYRVFARHMRDLGTPTQSRTFFEAIVSEFPDDVWIGCAYLGEQPVAAGCAVRWGAEVEMTWASSLFEYNRLAPNMGLYWAFIERAAEAGVRRFNFGRCTPDGGTHRFKRQWGGRDETLWWYYRARRGPGTTPSPTEGPFSWGPRLWRRLPLPVANALGPRIVQFLP